ncbi:hypothetical protein M7I_7627 [Glarea lozoyensis 74030]|uniref:Uncharacterized protein n=1 Tax=Glarea lozoyensis (strain ATCC 74030 / MF5533) TaxID=1104152 RepID=H0EXT7_GLAL7|nr:hypothetical protein M7I_7627 [Glarea lozoyensis 74030]
MAVLIFEPDVKMRLGSARAHNAPFSRSDSYKMIFAILLQIAGWRGMQQQCWAHRLMVHGSLLGRRDENSEIEPTRKCRGQLSVFQQRHLWPEQGIRWVGVLVL